MQPYCLVAINQLPPGVRPIDHVADVGIRIGAPDLESLFDRAAAGMTALIRGDDEEAGGGPRPGARTEHDAGPGTEPAARMGSGQPSSDTATEATATTRRIELSADDVAMLLANWLRELLFLHETHALAYAGARFDRLTERALEAEVFLVADAGAPIREIKGVTYHGLEATRGGGGWSATVIFDV